MKIKYLGTAAAEGWPGVFCNCVLCKKALESGGKNIRTRSQALIDDSILIDFPPDTYAHYIKYKFNLSDIKTLLVTHSHTDHFYVTDLTMRCKPLAHNLSCKMQIYGNSKVEKMFYDTMPSKYNVKDNYDFIKVDPFVPLHIDKYTITPLLANHDKSEQCLLYLIEDTDKCLLYGNDTGMFLEATWEYLKNKHIDLVSLDCTSQSIKDGKNHMGLADTIEVKERLEALGITDENTKYVLNHFSHNGGWLHQEMEKNASQYDFMVAYDGFEIEI
jgi:phosphoribosyl 1,2-cyclic phosphate phosphodiesterase